MALGKNLKRVKLLPETDSKEKKPSAGKEAKKAKPSISKKKTGKSVKKDGGEASSTISKKTAAKKQPVTTKPAKTAVREKGTPSISTPQVSKTKKLSEKDRLQRQSRRELYVQELINLKNTTTTWIIFEIEKELFAIDIAMTQRVIPTPEISSLPHTAAHIMGVAEVRKRPVIFVDLSKKYGLNKDRQGSEGLSYALIVKPSVDLVAILLKNVPQTLKINGNQLIPLPETANLIPNKESFIKFMYKLEEKIVYMLDIEGLILADQGILDVKSLKTTV